MRLPFPFGSASRSIAVRLHLATAGSLVAVGVLLATVYWLESARLVRDRVAMLQAIADSATGIAVRYEEKARAGQMSREEAQHAAALAISGMRYAGGQYLWINTTDLRMVMHPTKPDLDGTDLRDVRDPNGVALFAVAADLVRANGNGTLEYSWPRPDAAQPVPKLSFVQGFAPWGWIIGTGVYIDDLVAMKRQFALMLAGLGLAVSAGAGAAVALLGRGVTRPLRALTRQTQICPRAGWTLSSKGRGAATNWARWRGRSRCCKAIRASECGWRMRRPATRSCATGATRRWNAIRRSSAPSSPACCVSWPRRRAR